MLQLSICAACVQFQVRLVPALLKKPTDAKSQIGDKPAPSSKEETGLEQDAAAASKEQNKKDVFAPPYVPNLLVQELGDHVVLVSVEVLVLSVEAQADPLRYLPHATLPNSSTSMQWSRTTFCS